MDDLIEGQGGDKTVRIKRREDKGAVPDKYYQSVTKESQFTMPYRDGGEGEEDTAND
jgi:hypothetical protein